MNKALFGGALLAAGTVANGQEFIYADASPDGAYSSFAYLTDTRSYETVIAYAPDSLEISLNSANGLSMSVSQDSNSFRMDGVWDGSGSSSANAYGGGLIQQYFQVSQDATLRVSWDVAATDLFMDAIVVEDASGNLLFQLDTLGGTNPPAGSADIALSAGTDYLGQILFGTPSIFGGLTFPFFEVPNQNSFIQFEVIPAPASVALLAGAGLFATRRRS